jgi:long-subunit fatty acid transport protein
MLLISISTFAGEKTGTTSGAFLKISALPGIAAMGNSYSSLSLGPGSAAYNPAGIIGSNNFDFALSYTRWFADISNNFFGAVYNSRHGSFGFSLISLSTDDMEITTPNAVYGTGEYFKSSEYAVGLSYAEKMTDKLNLGATIKVIKSFLYNDQYSANAIAFDAGTIYNLNDKYSLGITLKNLGSDIKYINESNNLPASLSLGFSGRESFGGIHHILWALQAIRYSDSDEKYSFGIEYNYNSVLYIRTGYQFAFGSESESNAENISGGIGINYYIYDLLMKLDYSYTNYKWLSGIHRISLQVGI